MLYPWRGPHVSAFRTNASSVPRSRSSDSLAIASPRRFSGKTRPGEARCQSASRSILRCCSATSESASARPLRPGDDVGSMALTMTPPVPRLPRWAVSVLSVLAAAGLGRLLAPSVGAESAYLLFTVAVMVSARYGGLWSGLAATVFGGAVVLGVFVTSPASPAQWLMGAVFLAVGA